MSLEQREHFLKLYSGTKQVINDLCLKGEYQENYLKHAPCLNNVHYDECTKTYQAKMAMYDGDVNETDTGIVSSICCSFREYLDCSERAAYDVCGFETAKFTRGVLDRMSSSLIKTHCEKIIKTGVCSSGKINSINLSLLLFIIIFLFFKSFVNFR